MAEHEPQPDPNTKSLLTPELRAAIQRASPYALVRILSVVLFLMPRLLRQTAHALHAKERLVKSIRRTRPKRLQYHEARLQEMKQLVAKIVEILEEDPPLHELPAEA